jgi:hypothetical protein
MLGACLADLPPADPGVDTGNGPIDTGAPANQPPGGHSLGFDDRWPSPEEDLTCSIELSATDPDGDPISYSFAWTVNGKERTPASSGASHSTLSSVDMAAGDAVACTATASDEQDSTEATVAHTIALGSWTFAVLAPGMKEAHAFEPLWLDHPDNVAFSTCAETISGALAESNREPGWANYVEFAGTSAWEEYPASGSWNLHDVSVQGDYLRLDRASGCMARTSWLEHFNHTNADQAVQITIHPQWSPNIESYGLRLCRVKAGCADAQTGAADQLIQVRLTREGEEEGTGKIVLDVGENVAVRTLEMSTAIVPSVAAMGSTHAPWTFTLDAAWTPAPDAG